MNRELVLRAGSTASGGWAVNLTAERAGWHHSSLHVADLAAGEAFTFATGEEEMLLLPLRGSVTVTAADQTIALDGRVDVFTGPTDMVYLPRDMGVTLTSERGASVALPGATARRALPLRHVPAANTPVELRGAGRASRQVNNLATPDVLDTDRLIACEVLTPAGNTSSWPPHRHDRTSDVESELEEVYYMLISDAAARRPGASPDAGIGYVRVYGDDQRPVDVLAEVRSGDIVLVPHGWHGPAIALPGYDMYYLNVMAGPEAERAWKIVDDPAHGWVRGGWADEPVDPRLPFYPAAEAGGAGTPANDPATDPAVHPSGVRS